MYILLFRGLTPFLAYHTSNRFASPWSISAMWSRGEYSPCEARATVQSFPTPPFARHYRVSSHSPTCFALSVGSWDKRRALLPQCSLLTFDYTPRSRASQVTPSPLTFEVWFVRKRSFAYETQQHHMG